MFSDYIIFWWQNNQQPAFESEFEMRMYEMQCQMDQFADGMRRMIAAIPAVVKTMNDLASAMNKFSTIRDAG